MLEDHIASMARRIAALEQRADNAVKHGTVTDVDAKKQLVRLRVGGTDQEPQKSPWIPYGQIAGAMKVHTPPSEGQQMTLFSPTGDYRQALALPFTWSDQNKSPSEKPDEHVLKFGDVTVTIKIASVTIAVGESSITIEKEKITAKSKRIETDGATHLDKGEEQVKLISDAPAKRVYAKP